MWSVSSRTALLLRCTSWTSTRAPLVQRSAVWRRLCASSATATRGSGESLASADGEVATSENGEGESIDYMDPKVAWRIFREIEEEEKQESFWSKLSRSGIFKYILYHGDMVTTYKKRVGLPVKDLESHIHLSQIYIQMRNLMYSDMTTREWREDAADDRTVQLANSYKLFPRVLKEFWPSTILDVAFSQYRRVYRGNWLLPAMARTRPTFTLVTDEECGESHFCVLAFDPDVPGHDHGDDQELIDVDLPVRSGRVTRLHWLVNNIEVKSTRATDADGVDAVQYLPPLPVRGSGTHRLVFLACAQPSETMAPVNITQWDERVIDLDLFLQEHQLRPTGLLFSQLDWDDSVTDYYSNVLEKIEPVYITGAEADRIRKKAPRESNGLRHRMAT